jgi:cytoskeletal protein CcmA (bactofilin family)
MISSQDDVGHLYFGPKSEVDGEIEGKDVTMAGKMRGVIESPRITMADTARFSGEIYTKKGLTVETGAKMSAKIKMKRKRKKQQKKTEKP